LDLTEILRWTASTTGMIAAILVAANAGARISGSGFVIFSVSSLIWIAASVLSGNSPLAVQNVVLLAINLFGVYRYLWQPAGEPDESGDE